jgi:hydroxyacylglutathione hydrolase
MAWCRPAQSPPRFAAKGNALPLLIDIFLCRTDNYGYLVHDVETRKTAAIDAPDAKAIRGRLAARGWSLTDIFVTHHHHDHVEAIPVLDREFSVKVTGPAAEAEKIAGIDVPVEPGDRIQLGATPFTVIGTPGHTLGHVAYHDPYGGHLFSADALFSMGVGRMFEGKAQQMWEGLEALMELPDATLIYCGHEYSEANARFAQSVEPANPALRLRAAEVARMRAAGAFTIPVTLGMEKATNPFLRAGRPQLAKAMGLPPGSPVHVVFGALRKAKDDFK